MQHKQITKSKNDLLKSIMTSPKLSKTFSEAVSAPIGSTKRAQAKSVLSIMRKLGGLRADGQGGMESGITQMPMQSAPVTPPAKNYANMVIFPAAPAFKKRAAEVPTPATPAPTPSFQNNFQRTDGQGGPETGLTDGSNYSWDQASTTPATTTPATSTPAKTYSWNQPAPASTESKLGPGVLPNAYGAYSDWMINSVKPTAAYPALAAPLAAAGVAQTIGQNSLAALEWGGYGLASLGVSGLPKPTTPFIAPQNTWGFQKIGAGLRNVLGIENPYNAPPAAVDAPSDVAKIEAAKGQAKWEDGSNVYNAIIGPKPGSTNVTEKKTVNADGSTTITKADGSSVVVKTDGTTTVIPPAAPASTMPGAWNYPGGVTGFALDAVDKRYPDGLAAYVAGITKKATDTLGPLETELSNLKARKENLVPTLTNYVKGKDQYLRFIDDMIRKQEENFKNIDTTNPSQYDTYKQSIEYLYLLKGRQENRYSNFLKSATADYEAEVARAQANYDSVSNRLQTAITQEAAIAQEDYNNLYNRALALATEAKGAEAAAYTTGILKAQYTTATKGILDSVPGAQTNNAYLAEAAGWEKLLSVNKGVGDPTTGTIDFTKIPANGLSGLYYQNQYATGDPAAITEAIRRVFATTLANPETSAADKAKINSMVQDLINTPETAIFGKKLQAELSPSSGGSANITPALLPKVKNAVNDLVKGYGGMWVTGWGGNSPGVQDPEAWLAKYTPILGAEMASKLLKAITKAMASETYANKPDVLIQEIFADGTGETLSAILSTIQ